MKKNSVTASSDIALRLNDGGLHKDWLYGRSEPNLDDLGLAFKDLGILLHELEEYVNNVEPVPFAHQVSAFPVQHSNNLQHAKPSSRELLHRPEWIHEHLPPMHPELEEEESMLLSPSSTVDGPVKKLGPETTPNSTGGETPSPLGSPRPSAKRSLDLSGEVPNVKKSRLYAEEEGRPMREVTSVFMTPSGLVSPAREGKLPDSCAPQKFDSPPPTPEPDTEIPEPVIIRKELKIKDIRKDKDKSFRLKKNKLGIIKKVNKKIKTSKKERENKENANVKVEKSSNPSSTGHKKESDGHIAKSKKDKSESKQKGKSEKSRSKELKNKHKLASKLLKSKLKTSKSGSISISLVSSKSHKVVKTPSRVKTSVSVKANKPEKLPPLLVSSSLIKPVPQIIKEIKQEKIITPVKVEVKEERPELKMEEIVCDMRFREESPEPRLVIDDSAEAQARQEMESRLAVLDECIDAVIQRSREESERKAEESEKAVDETIDEVVKYVAVKKNEPKDIYEFTDSSDGSLPPTPKTPDTIGSPLMRSKKEKTKTVENNSKGSSNSDGLKKGKDKSRDRPKKKTAKEAKSKTPTMSPSPKAQKSGMSSFSKILPEKKPSTPSPVEKKDTDLDDSSSPISSSPTGYLSAHTPTTPVRQLPPPTLSRFPLPPPFIPSSSSLSTPTFGSSPFSPIRPIPCHFQSNPFPTPPLFVPPKPEVSNIFNPPAIPQPLNLAMSGPNTPVKVPAEKKPQLPVQAVLKVEEETIEIKKIKLEDISEKIKSKDHRKEKKDKEKSEKKDKIKKKNRDKSKGKSKDKNDELKEKEKGLKEKSKSKDKIDKPKSDKKGKNKGDKKKGKEEKGKEDNSIPKITFKLGGGTSTSGSTRIVIKSLTKSSDSRASSPQKEPVPPVPAPQPVKLSPPRVPTPPSLPPSPPHVPTPPPPPHVPTPPPPRDPTPPPKSQPPPPTPVVLAPPPSSPKPSPTPPPRTPTPPPQTTPPPAQPPPKPAQSTQPSKPAQSTGGARGRGKGKSSGAKRGASAATQTPARTVVTETLGTIVDESGNKIWICPACTHPDDGSPMIGCDECDDWYHWVCVSIVVPPKEEESWFCQRCIARQQVSAVKRRRKKHRKDK